MHHQFDIEIVKKTHKKQPYPPTKCVIIYGLTLFDSQFTERGRGVGYKMGKSQVQNFLCHPPPLPSKEWKLFAPPFNMAKTSRYRIKDFPYTFCAPPPLSA